MRYVDIRNVFGIISRPLGAVVADLRSFLVTLQLQVCVSKIICIFSPIRLPTEVLSSQIGIWNIGEIRYWSA